MYMFAVLSRPWSSLVLSTDTRLDWFDVQDLKISKVEFQHVMLCMLCKKAKCFVFKIPTQVHSIPIGGTHIETTQAPFHNVERQSL
jgi:hypothetical protein